MKKKKINYLNNKDLLDEIGKSKLTFCQFTEEDSEKYDFIVDTPRPESRGKKVRIPPPSTIEYSEMLEGRRAQCLSPDTVATAIKNRADRLSKFGYDQAMKGYVEAYDAHVDAIDGGTIGKNEPFKVAKPTKKEYTVDPDDIMIEDLVIRFHTFEHIPLSDNTKDNPVTEADYREKVSFVPFIQYKYDITDGKVSGLRIVGRSHFKEGIYSNEHGDITPKLANMFILLTNKYAQKHNWRGYTYVDDMKGNALLQLSIMGLQFNEARSDNPFAYLTTTLKNAFLRVLQSEKKEQDIRDDLIEKSGQTPSNTRQMDHDKHIQEERERLNNNVN